MQGLSSEELARRVAASRPEWANYQENIKGQIGATPVAEWDGEPIAASASESSLEITFRLSGPWASRELALPVLVRDPYGALHRHERAVRDGSLVRYYFAREQPTNSSPLAWVEILYPHHEDRIVFDAAGKWKKNE